VKEEEPKHGVLVFGEGMMYITRAEEMMCFQRREGKGTCCPQVARTGWE
jgi:hypothetical protein